MARPISQAFHRGFATQGRSVDFHASHHDARIRGDDVATRDAAVGRMVLRGGAASRTSPSRRILRAQRSRLLRHMSHGFLSPSALGVQFSPNGFRSVLVLRTLASRRAQARRTSLDRMVNQLQLAYPYLTPTAWCTQDRGLDTALSLGAPPPTAVANDDLVLLRPGRISLTSKIIPTLVRAAAFLRIPFRLVILRRDPPARTTKSMRAN